MRFMGRGLRRSPGFTLTVVLMLALGIGVNTAVFSVVNSVLLKPLPYPGADRLVVFRASFPARNETQTLVTIANFRDWRDRSSTFEAMSSYRPGENSVTTGALAKYGHIASVDARFFSVFAVEPIIGRAFRADEIHPECTSQRARQSFVLAEPAQRRSASARADDSRRQYGEVDYRRAAAGLPVPSRNRCVAAPDDELDQPHRS